MSAQWTFVLTDAGGNALAELSTASGRTIAFKRNSYAEVNLTLSHEDDAASLLFSALNNTGVPRLKAYRRGTNDAAAVLKFRGPLMGLQETSEETSLLTATFRSPFSVLVGDGDKAGRFLTSQFPTIYNAMDAGVIASDLISIANLDSPTGLGTDLSLIASTTARNATYPVGQNVGSAIMNLSALLDGFDFYETFVDTPPVGVGLPSLTPSIGSGGNFGGSGVPAGTYFWIVAPRNIDPTALDLGVSFAVTTGQTAIFTWTSVSGATGYDIYRASSIAGLNTSPALIGGVGPTATSFTDVGNAPLTGAFSARSTSAEAYFNVVASLGVVNTGARFEYGPATLSNVMHMDRTTTPPLNTLFVTGGNGLTSIYSDDTSVAKYGKWWGHYDFPDVIDQSTLDAKARALTRPNPVKTLTLIPELGLDNCPQPFDDWNLGDTVPFFASRGALSEDTQIRVNGFTVPIDENGFETVSVNDPTSPEEDSILTAQLTAEVDVT